MSVNKHEQVDSVKAYKRRRLAKNPMHMITRSPFLDSQLTNEKKNLELNQKKTQQNYNNKIQYITQNVIQNNIINESKVNKLKINHLKV